MSNNPLHGLPEVPSFTVTSTDVAEGENFQTPQLSGAFGVEGGEDRSPQLSWSGAPDGTKGYAVTCFDPDAPTQSGFWHWTVLNIPASVTELPAGAGDEAGTGLPAGAIQLAHDGGARCFVGAAPPPGHGAHRYYFIVHALDTDDLGVPETASPALANFMMLSHVIGRAVLVAHAQR